jgi:hypothetical protein
VTLTTNCENSSNDGGCLMSFNASGGLTQTASDNFATGNGRAGGGSDRQSVTSATYLVTVTGSTTFTARYRRTGGGTATFNASSIIIQVY